MRLRNPKPLLLAAGLLVLGAAVFSAPVPSALSPKAADHVERADKYKEDGALSSAIVEMKNALTEAPDDAGLRYKLGLLYLDVGDGAAAQRSIERAMGLGMTDFSARLALARAWLLQGNYQDILFKLDEHKAPTASDKAAANLIVGKARLRKGEPEAARGALRAALTALPQYSPAFVSLAMLSLMEGDLDSAGIFLKGAERGVEADRAEVQWLQGQLDYERGQYAAAEAAFAASLAQRPSEVLRRRDLAAAQMAQGKFAEADANLKQVLLVGGDAATIHFQSLLAYLQKDYAQAGQLASNLAAKSVGSPALFIAGASAYQLGSYEQAREHLSQYVALHPDDLAARAFLARTLLRMDDAGEAYATLLPVAERAARDADLLSLLGTAAIMAGKRSQGEAYLKQAVALRPQDPALRARLAAAQAAGGDRAAGIAELTRLAQQDTGLKDIGIILAQAHIRGGEFDQAVAAMQQQRGKGSDESAAAWVVEGLALLGKGDLDAAEKAFQQVIGLSPNNPDAQTGLAEVKLRKGDPDGARRILDGLLKTHPDRVKAMLNLAAFEAQTGHPDQAIARIEEGIKQQRESIELQVALAAYLTQAGRPGDALKFLDSLAALDNPDLLVARGQAELLADRPEAAMRTFRRLVEVRPEDVAAQLALAKAYERGAEPDQAAAALDAAVKLDPARLDARVARDRFALLRPNPKKKEVTEAINDIVELGKAYPNDARVGEVRGVVAWRLKRPEEAIALLTATQSALGTSESADILAEVQWQTGLRDQALKTLDDWVLQHPGDNYARLRLARLQLGAGELQGAARSMEQALKSGAQRPDLDAALAWALVNSGRVAQAKPYALEAYAKSTTNPLTLHAMGRVYLEEGQTADAVTLLGRAMQAPTPNARLQLDYARALLATGKRAQAKALLDKLLAGGAEFPEKQEALALRQRAGN